MPSSGRPAAEFELAQRRRVEGIGLKAIKLYNLIDLLQTTPRPFALHNRNGAVQGNDR